MENQTTLKIGDVIFRRGPSGALMLRLTIDRVTKTLAVSGSYRFKINACGSGYLTHTEQPRWDTSLWLKSTPELEQKWYRQIKLNHVKDFDYSKLPDEKLDAIIAILNEPKQ